MILQRPGNAPDHSRPSPNSWTSLSLLPFLPETQSGLHNEDLPLTCALVSGTKTGYIQTGLRSPHCTYRCVCAYNCINPSTNVLHEHKYLVNRRCMNLYDRHLQRHIVFFWLLIFSELAFSPNDG